MPIYELRCGHGHTFEVIQSFTAPLPPCPGCESGTTKIPSRFGIAGRAALPPPPEAMPQTWRGTYDGNRRPILAHEGRYEAAPLRAGDALPSVPPAAGRGGHQHHQHAGGHPHQHHPAP